MSAESVAFFVPGIPAPQGSKRAFVVKGRPVMTEASARSRPWRTEVNHCAHAARPEGWDAGVPVVVELDFGFARPKSHLTSKGELRKGRRWSMTSKPDIDKLARNILDALIGALFVDDAQVVHLVLRKHYVDDVLGRHASVDVRAPGVWVRVQRAE